MDDMIQLCTKNFVGFAPSLGQSLILDFYGTSMILKTISLVADAEVKLRAFHHRRNFTSVRHPRDWLM